MYGHVVGRESELAAVEVFLDSIGEGFSALVLEGEPAIGKTTVWQDAVARAEQRGYRTLACRPAQAEAKLSFAALSDLLEPVPPEAFAGLPEPQGQALEIAWLRVPDRGSAPEPRAASAGCGGCSRAWRATRRSWSRSTTRSGSTRRRPEPWGSPCGASTARASVRLPPGDPKCPGAQVPRAS